MILPTITSISFDSLMTVPPAFREGSFAMGATKWQTVYRIVLPAARSGILASFILGMGRAVGETMAVIMVAGNALKIPTSLTRPAAHPHEQYRPRARLCNGRPPGALFSTGVVLLVIIMSLNLLANFWVKRRVAK